MLSDTERHMRLNHFVRKYLQRGYSYAAHSQFSAELHRPARFPHWLFRETTLYVNIDPEGRIFVARRRE